MIQNSNIINYFFILKKLILNKYLKKTLSI